MLVLSRKLSEQIQIGDNVTITVLRIKGNTVRIGIDAPQDVRVVRGELPPKREIKEVAVFRSNPQCDEIIEVSASELSNADEGTGSPKKAESAARQSETGEEAVSGRNRLSQHGLGITQPPDPADRLRDIVRSVTGLASPIT